jgi:hypothetical protein
MAHPLDGIREKLNRADENIGNLNREIGAFLDEGIKAVLSYQDYEARSEAFNVHFSREVPPRFSILAGEVVHHLRSSLDHLAWLLSSEVYRKSNSNHIEFPILISKPDKNKLAGYNRKVQGISSKRALGLIHNYQPYHRPNPPDDPLAIVHNFDRIDKHRELVIVVPSFNLRFDDAKLLAYMRHKQAKAPLPVLAALETKMKEDAELTPQVAFKNFGRREGEPVVEGLKTLLVVVGGIVEMFKPEF